MFNTIIQFLLNLLIKFSALLMSIFTAPILALVSVIFPNLDIYISTFNVYLNNYVLPGVAFAREVFLNVTGYPRSLLSTLAFIFLAKLTFKISIIPLRFLYNILRLLISSLPQDNLSTDWHESN